MKKAFDGYWIRLVSDKKPNYKITGKYLFFNSDKDRLIDIAINEFKNHGFHHAKVNMNLLKGKTDHVLCLYYKDDSRKYELAERNKEKYGVKYRYWKSDEDTLKGKYSKEHLEILKERGISWMDDPKFGRMMVINYKKRKKGRK